VAVAAAAEIFLRHNRWHGGAGRLWASMIPRLTKGTQTRSSAIERPVHMPQRTWLHHPHLLPVVWRAADEPNSRKAASPAFKLPIWEEASLSMRSKQMQSDRRLNWQTAHGERFQAAATGGTGRWWQQINPFIERWA
jgi:hypothetical protein